MNTKTWTPLMIPAEAARYLGVRPHDLSRWTREKKIGCIQLGRNTARYRKSVLDSFRRSSPDLLESLPAAQDQTIERLGSLAGKLQTFTYKAEPCIYLLMRDGVVTYVGQTVDLAARANSHRGGMCRGYTEILFFPVPVDELNEVEGAVIRYLRPPRNRSLGCRPIEGKKTLIKYGILEAENE